MFTRNSSTSSSIGKYRAKSMSALFDQRGNFGKEALQRRKKHTKNRIVSTSFSKHFGNDFRLAFSTSILEAFWSSFGTVSE